MQLPHDIIQYHRNLNIEINFKLTPLSFDSVGLHQQLHVWAKHTKTVLSNDLLYGKTTHQLCRHSQCSWRHHFAPPPPVSSPICRIFQDRAGWSCKHCVWGEVDADGRKKKPPNVSSRRIPTGTEQADFALACALTQGGAVSQSISETGCHDIFPISLGGELVSATTEERRTEQDFLPAPVCFLFSGFMFTMPTPLSLCQFCSPSGRRCLRGHPAMPGLNK